MKITSGSYKIDFKNEVPDIVTVHGDENLLTALNARN